MGWSEPARKRREHVARGILKKHPDAGHRTLARALHENNPLLFPTIEQARSALRYLTGNNGEALKRSAKNRALFRKARLPGQLPPLPKSYAKPWLPYKLEAASIGVLSDIHLPYHSELALQAAIDWLLPMNLDALLLNGDVFDFYQISRHDKDPTQPKLMAELHAGWELFACLRAAFPDARIVYKLGNHDERWDKYLQLNAPMLCEIDEVRNAWHIPAGIKEFGIEIVDDQRPVMLGKLPVFHGHELGRSTFSPVNPARGAFMRSHHTILVGHSHQTSGHADTNVWHDETFCWSTGCLCDRSPNYARINRWNWGFAYVEVDEDGESFNVQNLRISKSGKVRQS
jgi:predicted phosphodiesterase